MNTQPRHHSLGRFWCIISLDNWKAKQSSSWTSPLPVQRTAPQGMEGHYKKAKSKQSSGQKVPTATMHTALGNGSKPFMLPIKRTGRHTACDGHFKLLHNSKQKGTYLNHAYMCFLFAVNFRIHGKEVNHISSLWVAYPETGHPHKGLQSDLWEVRKKTCIFHMDTCSLLLLSAIPLIPQAMQKANPIIPRDYFSPTRRHRFILCITTAC